MRIRNKHVKGKKQYNLISEHLLVFYNYLFMLCNELGESKMKSCLLHLKH